MGQDAPAVPKEVVSAFRLDPSSLATVDAGLINRTYFVKRGSAPSTTGELGAPPKTDNVAASDERHVLQCVNRMFRPEVHLDIQCITDHLAQRGLTTPQLVPTREGGLWFASGKDIWRLLTYVPGRTIDTLPSPALARAAGRAVGRFHQALSDLEHRFAFVRPGAHDTPKHLAHLEHVADEHRAHPLHSAVAAVAEAILEHGSQLPAVGTLPERIIHGDLKCQNLRFTSALDDVVALLDLDTLAHSTIAIEMGDALRSWCNPAGEDDPRGHVSVELFTGAVDGYLAGVRGLLDQNEKRSLVPGTETIALELASRFCADALEENYFGWNRERYTRAGAHNLVRAQGQLALARSVRTQRRRLERAVDEAVRHAMRP